MNTLPEALRNLTPIQQREVLDRMRTITRNSRGERLATDAQARAELDRRPTRSSSSLSGEFFSSRAADTGCGTPSAHAPNAAQIAAELERIRAGNLAMMLQKPAPSTGAWSGRKGAALPRTGWTLARIDDTGMPGGALCELCEKTQSQHAYVVTHEAWPTDAPGAEMFACRLCAVHLLGTAIKRKPTGGATASPHAKAVSWSGSGGRRARNGELRPERRRGSVPDA